MAIQTLSIDLETFSDVDLKKCGVYKYAESPNFEVLLFGVSVDGGEVTVYDLASGDTVPEEIIRAISDDSVIKWAYNASFERVCLSVWLRRNYPQYFSSYSIEEDTVLNYLDPSSWRCSLVWGAYMGLPLSLEGIGKVLKLENQKMAEGKALIRYFCVPCKPTKANGGRTRNLPKHDPVKWSTFIAYNKRDVETEMAIQQKLSKFPVPEFLWEEYHLDQEINDRGIQLDMALVEQAIAIDARSREELSAKMRQLTALENPNSVQQVKEWLTKHGLEVDSLDKKAVKELLKTAPPELAEVLELRRQLAKSSVKKYQAMQNAVCADGRARGMFQFYGANRSGRWAGRLIQLQNLPQNHMAHLEDARSLVRSGDYALLSALYDSVPEVLSELIRTAFVPRDGYKFIVSDFSAIEARVLSFLAGESWRLKVFDEGGDIYCASASKMFHVPVEKHGQNAHLRQKGKQAELACIAEGQLVLTDKGLIPIEAVTTDHRLWDGQNWVTHEGVIYKGEREVIDYEGLRATPDHLVWVEGKPEPVQFGLAAACGAHLIQTGDGRKAIRLGEDYQRRETLEQIDEPLLCTDAMHRMRLSPVAVSYQPQNRKIQGLPEMLTATYDSLLAGQAADSGKTAMRESKRSGIPKLRWPGNKIYVSERKRSRALPVEYLRTSEKGTRNRPYRQQQRLCAGQSPLCNPYGKQQQQEMHRTQSFFADVLALCQAGCNPQALPGADQGRDHSGRGNGCIRKAEKLERHQRKARLYDIRNAGEHHRFTVSGKLVHNCGYGGSVGALKAMGALEAGMTEEELQPLVDAWRTSNPNIVQFWWDVDNAVKTTVRQRLDTETHGIRFRYRSGMLFIILPSSRQLCYVKPKMGVNKFGGDSVTYEGVGSTKKWERIESYGPKFVENIVQAVSRDILMYAIRTLSHCFIVGHVHDELIIECSMGVSLDAVCEQMGRTPPWIKGLNLRADGYETMFYKKD